MTLHGACPRRPGAGCSEETIRAECFTGEFRSRAGSVEPPACRKSRRPRRSSRRGRPGASGGLQPAPELGNRRPLPCGEEARTEDLRRRLQEEGDRGDREDEERNLINLLIRARTGLKAPLESMRRRLETMERAFSPKIMLREIEQHGMRLDELSSDLKHNIRRKLDSDANRLKAIQASLDELDPTRVLGRGYSILRSSSGDVLSSVSKVNEGDEVSIVMRDGVLEAEVTRKG